MNVKLEKLQNVQNEGSSRTVDVGFGRKVVLKNNLRPETPAVAQSTMEEQRGYSARTFGTMTGLFGVSKVDQLKKLLDQKKVA